VASTPLNVAVELLCIILFNNPYNSWICALAYPVSALNAKLTFNYFAIIFAPFSPYFLSLQK